MLRHHSSCSPLEHVTSHDNSSSLCSVPEGDQIVNLNMSNTFESLHSKQELPPLRPRRSSDIDSACLPQDMMINAMIELNRHGVSARGFDTNMLVSKILPSRMVDMEQSLDQRRFLSDKDTYTCPVSN